MKLWLLAIWSAILVIVFWLEIIVALVVAPGYLLWLVGLLIFAGLVCIFREKIEEYLD